MEVRVDLLDVLEGFPPLFQAALFQTGHADFMPGVGGGGKLQGHCPAPLAFVVVLFFQIHFPFYQVGFRVFGIFLVGQLPILVGLSLLAHLAEA